MLYDVTYPRNGFDTRYQMGLPANLAPCAKHCTVTLAPRCLMRPASFDADVGLLRTATPRTSVVSVTARVRLTWCTVAAAAGPAGPSVVTAVAASIAIAHSRVSAGRAICRPVIWPPFWPAPARAAVPARHPVPGRPS